MTYGYATTKVLGNRERQTLALIAAGHTNEEIAGRLYVSASTVKSFVLGVQTKLGARNRAHCVHLAHQQGLLEEVA